MAYEDNMNLPECLRSELELNKLNNPQCYNDIWIGPTLGRV
jgi:hypothetical protein